MSGYPRIFAVIINANRIHLFNPVSVTIALLLIGITEYTCVCPSETQKLLKVSPQLRDANQNKAAKYSNKTTFTKISNSVWFTMQSVSLFSLSVFISLKLSLIIIIISIFVQRHKIVRRGQIRLNAFLKYSSKL